jgi:PilZ domain
MSDSSDEESKLTKGIEYRRFSRGDVDITIDVREYAGGKHRAKMLDLSQSGCRVESVTLLREDRHVFITLPGFAPLEAQVVWHHKANMAVHLLTDCIQPFTITLLPNTRRSESADRAPLPTQPGLPAPPISVAQSINDRAAVCDVRSGLVWQ